MKIRVMQVAAIVLSWTTAAAAAPPHEGRSTPHIEIEASRLSCIAPCGVHFRAGGLDKLAVGRPFHDLSFDWRFGDEGADFRSLPPNFPRSNDANRASGPFAAHVFERPGTYRVTLTAALPGGTQANDGAVVRVIDPDKAFPGKATICYSRSAEFAGCPVGAVRDTSLEGAFAALKRRKSGRLLLRAGERTEVPALMSLRNFETIRIGRFGEGQDPVLIPGPGLELAFIRFWNTVDATVSNLRFEGDYDASTGQGDDWDVRAFFGIGSDTSGDITLHQNSVDGLNALLTAQRGYDRTVISDNDVTNWYDYGVYIGPQSEDLAFIGNSMRQRLDAVSGTGAKSDVLPRWADHGPIRMSTSVRVVIAQNDLQSTTGWSSEGRAHQPALRYNTSGEAGHSGVIGENRLQGGLTIVSMAKGNAGPVGLGDVLVEQNHFMGSPNTRMMIVTPYGNTTIRNNVMEMPDVPNSWLPFKGFVMLRMRETSPANRVAPVTITNNEMINRQKVPEAARDPVRVEEWEGLALVECGNGVRE